MTADRLLTRRRFLGALTVAGTWLLARRLGPLRTLGQMAGQEGLASRLVQLFRSPASAACIGQAYLQQAPHEGQERRLLARLCPAGRRWHMADASQLHRMLREQQADDFAQGRVVLVHGWTLSVTEARLCALAALHARAA